MPRVIPIATAAGPDLGFAACAGAEPFALMVLGDSMLPEFAEGEIVVIEPGGFATHGTYVLAWAEEGWILRRLAGDAAGWRLEALNSAFPALAIPDLSPVRGVVIQKARPGRRRLTKCYIE